MPEFNLKAGIILRARCLHWKQMDRGRGQQLNAVENVNNVKRHSATRRSNGGSWAARSRGGSAKRGSGVLVVLPGVRGGAVVGVSVWARCGIGPADDTQTDRSERLAARTRWKQLFCGYLIIGHLDKQTQQKKKSSYLGTESPALCDASSVELTYSLTYTNPLNQEPQLGSEVRGCILFTFLLHYVPKMNKPIAISQTAFYFLNPVAKNIQAEKTLEVFARPKSTATREQRVARVVPEVKNAKYVKYEKSGTSLSNIIYHLRLLCKMTHFLASGSGVRTRCSSRTAVLQSMAWLPRGKTAALAPVSLSTSVKHNSAG